MLRIAFVLAFVTAASAQEPRVLSPVAPLATTEVAAKVGSAVTLAAGDSAEWLLGSEAGKLLTDRGLCVVQSDTAARVVVLCRDSGKVKRFLIVFGDAGPGPRPPEPPPVDELAKRIADAYRDDNTPKDAAKSLAALYRAGAKYSKDDRFATGDALLEALRGGMNATIGSQLLAVRKLMSGELKAILGDSAAELTAAKRAALVSLFERAAAALEEASK